MRWHRGCARSGRHSQSAVLSPCLFRFDRFLIRDEPLFDLYHKGDVATNGYGCWDGSTKRQSIGHENGRRQRNYGTYAAYGDYMRSSTRSYTRNHLRNYSRSTFGSYTGRYQGSYTESFTGSVRYSHIPYDCTTASRNKADEVLWVRSLGSLSLSRNRAASSNKFDNKLNHKISNGSHRIFRRFIAYNEEVDNQYEIDLVSLKKVKLHVNNKINVLHDIDFESGINLKVDSIKLIKQICPKNLSGFFGTYSQELLTFMIYLQHDITSLKPSSIVDFLAKFKTDYLNRKIPVESVSRFNVFIENFMECLKDLRFMKQLPYEFNDLIPIYKAYAAGIGNFLPELSSLRKEKPLSISRLSEKIIRIDSDLKSYKSVIDSNYFCILIQLNRYKVLLNILSKFPKIDMNKIVDQPIYIDYNDQEIIKNHLNKIMLDLCETPVSFDSPFNEFAPELLNLNSESATIILKTLLNLFNHGIVDKSFRISNYLSIDSKYLPIILQIKLKFDCDFAKLSPKQIVSCLKSQMDQTNNPNLVEIIDLLSMKFKLNPDTQFLDQFTESDTLESPEYKQIPDNLYLHEYIYQLQILQEEVMGKPFKLFTADQVLERLHEIIYSNGNQLFEENLVDFTKLYYKLKTLFAINGGHTEILDLVIFNQSIFNEFERNLSSRRSSQDSFSPFTTDVDPNRDSQETLVPVDIVDPVTEANEALSIYLKNENMLVSQLDQFTREISVLRYIFLKVPFSKTSCETINSVLTKEINNIYSNDSSPHINNDNVLSFIRLHKRLNRIFKQNGNNCAILDKLVLVPKEDIELGLKPYVQIPESLLVHQFTQELIILQEILGKKFSESSPDEIDHMIDEKVSNVLNKSNISSLINADNVHHFIKLRQVLAKLFKINGGNTEVLDKVIYSTQVFDRFEKSRESSAEYRQLPDDFHLEEYVLELVQLRNNLGGLFATKSATEVLESILKLASTSVSPDKNTIWYKLYRNIAMLFYHNNNHTFVLDDILVNGEHFIDFEMNKALKKQVLPTIFDETSVLFNEYFEFIDKFYTTLGLENDMGIPKERFNELLETYMKSMERSYSYPIASYIVQTLRSINCNISYYPQLFSRLYDAKKVNDNLRLNGEKVEELYNEMIPNLDCVKIEKVPISETKSEEDLVTENGNRHELKNNYNDSERLLALLSKETEPANIEKLTDKSGVDDDSEFIIKDAISIAINQDHNDVFITKDNKDRKIDDKQSKRKRTRTPPSNRAEINTKSIESFLKKAKRDKETAKERKYREAEAYEWSKGTLALNNSISSDTFFEPGKNRVSSELLFPTRSQFNNEHVEYILLSIDGQTIPSSIEAIGRLPKEDIFQVLNKFDKNDLNKFMAHFKRLQNDHWKVVGSKNDISFDDGDKKYLILSRNKDYSKSNSWVLNRIRTLLATAGAVFSTMILANFILEDGSDQKVNDSTNKVNVKASSDVVEPVTEKGKLYENDGTKKSGWFWK
jgi:hypothetical protein